ncbi:hypothetical protein [Streptomyces sp. NPDC059122]|uniref:hypothetical protein n=1 Tax=Streptomyces sp. NPDC059122 TaxID=3346732 RepID=UPI0036BCF50C
MDDVLPELKAEVEKYETHTQEHREALQRLVVAQRQVRNTPEGYWVAAAGPEAAGHGLVGSTPLDQVRAAAVLSDGTSRLVLEYEMATWSEVFATLRAGGPGKLIDVRCRSRRFTPQTGAWG